MKTECEGCARIVEVDDVAYVCSYDCTFCPDCASRRQNVCPNCGGELVRRPRRQDVFVNEDAGDDEDQVRTRPGLVWAATLSIWTFISLAATATIYQLYRQTNGGMSLGTIAGMEFSQIFTYVPLTPLVFSLSVRYPLQRGNWIKRSLVHLAASLVFTLAHILLKGSTPYGYWDPATRQWGWAFWNSHTHVFRDPWIVLRSMFLVNVVDDATGAYVPIVLVAQAVWYYRRFRERELRATQLEGKLARAHLQTLKSQLQPHFLFNTMHSISALMLTDVSAADRMMSRLSDLLRLSLDAAATQITTLKRELEFVNCYLEIEKVRFEERMKITMDIPPETLDAQVPHLLLQPLVDNAVKHGISKRLSGGEIQITASLQDGDLQLDVKDNGPGLKKLTALPVKGLGLSITRERLRSLYGQDQSLELVSPTEGGLLVRILIPYRLQAEEHMPDVLQTASD